MYSYNYSYDLDTAEGTTPEIDFGAVGYAVVFIPAGSSITTLTFLVAPEPGGTYLPHYVTTSATTMTVQGGRAYQLPTTLSGVRAVKITVNAAGTVDISFQE
jgi:hypothetical protein